MQPTRSSPIPVTCVSVRMGLCVCVCVHLMCEMMLSTEYSADSEGEKRLSLISSEGERWMRYLVRGFVTCLWTRNKIMIAQIGVEPYVPEKAGKEKDEIVDEDQRGVRHAPCNLIFVHGVSQVHVSHTQEKNLTKFGK